MGNLLFPSGNPRSFAGFLILSFFLTLLFSSGKGLGIAGLGAGIGLPNAPEGIGILAAACDEPLPTGRENDFRGGAALFAAITSFALSDKVFMLGCVEIRPEPQRAPQNGQNLESDEI